jgi:FKBP-type peptidyl-prolyl cis-trans isomerase (trigger factor)
MTKEQTMSALRTRMIEDMQLAGLSAKTQEIYQQAVTGVVKHYHNRSPDQLTEEEVRRYLLQVRERNARAAPARRPTPSTVTDQSGAHRGVLFGRR